MVELRISGVEDTAALAQPVESELGLAVRVKAVVRPSVTRAAVEQVTVEAADDDLVELRLEGGAVLWLRADEVQDRLATGGHRGDTPEGVVAIEAELPLDDPARGLGRWAIEAVRVLGIDLARTSARKIAEALEAKAIKREGLFRWDGGEALSPFEAAAAGEQPWLVFIHGTASNTRGSFGDFRILQEGLWQLLTQTYPERILAFEHRTLTESPIANALALIDALPAGAELHLVSHSRGGLVGELLGRGRLTDAAGAPRAAFDETELRQFAGEELAAELATLGRLGEALARKALKVTRFVRVACPARGTSLMGGRIDRWLNLVFNVLGFATGGRLNPVTEGLLDALRALVQAVVKERTSPETLPGLAAMSPESSPLLRVLNRVDVRQDDGLHVVAGDVEPTAILRRLALWFADLYFGQDHDLVVDTASMDGGAQRLRPPYVFIDKGPKVIHFNYFANRDSASVVTNALVNPAALPPVPASLTRAAAESMPQPRSRGTAGRLPIVMILPGISGTHLKIGGQRIWIDLFSLARGGVGRLAITNTSVEPDELIARYYGGLYSFLEVSHEVRAWPYDWRRSILETARLFARDLGAALGATEHAVRIVAHSMGGLVARAALALDDDLRQRFNARTGSRLVMLGTPNGGSFSIPMLLLGRNRLMQYLALLDLKASARDQLEVVSRWPGAVQMLPHPDSDPMTTGGIDLYSVAGWAALAAADGGQGWVKPSADVLEDARRFRAVLDAAPLDPERMVYVAGQSETYSGFEITEAKDQDERIRFHVTMEGDGQVLWKTGIPDGIGAWYAPAAHGDLARHEPAFLGILDLLQRGATDRLSKTPPVVSRPRGAPPAVGRERVHLVPSEDDLLATAMGAAPSIAIRPDRRVTVRVVNGHLKFARYPLLVGHYIGDSLNGSELVLDREQNGRISRRRARGLHPGSIGTFDVHLDADSQPPGSVIVGLGEVSELTGGTLRQTVRSGLLALASAMDERDEKALGATHAVAERPPRGVSTVLVGSGGGVVTVVDCVQAILRAVREVNLQLKDSCFAEIELIELVEQQAINAWHTISRRLERAEFREAFTLESEVVCQRGAWRRIGPEDDRDWWTPITIRGSTEDAVEDGRAVTSPATERGALHYVVLSGRARAEATVVATRRSFIDLYLHRIGQQRVEEGATSPARTLFEMLWPNSLKEHSLGDRNIRLILDETAAALPWEMMDDRRPWLMQGSDGLAPELGPPAVRHGVIRQLVSTRIREAAIPAASRNKALVIGDPTGGGSRLRELPGAQREAKRVKEALERRGFEVMDLIGPQAKPEDVISALFAQAWQIVHIAAHGVFDHRFEDEPSSERKTGIVLGGSPETLVLDSAMFEQMPVTPELMFVNCCSLGAIDPTAETAYLRADRPALASSIAVQLIRMGVRAVIAAGWEVGDEPASRFADTFYEDMLRGDSFGRAMQNARQEVYKGFPTSSTWGAYQAYGHPDFRLSDVALIPRRPQDQHVFAAPAEAISEIERIKATIAVGGERHVEADLDDIARIEEVIAAKGWLDRGEVRAALAAAFAEFDDLDKAIEHYHAAALAEDGRVPVHAIEQQLNLLARRACRYPPDSGPPSPKQRITDSIEQLDALIRACGETQERLSLLGSAYKRLAQVETGEERTKVLGRMERAYRQARKLGQERGNPDVYYPWIQEITAKVILALRGRKPPRPDFAALQRSLRPAAADDFWRRVLPTDLRLLEQVGMGALPESEQEKVARDYAAVWKDTGSGRELSSVVGQVEFLIDMLADLGPGTDDLVTALRSTKERTVAATRA